MSEIVPHVYLSSIVYAKDLYWLKKKKISNILIIGQLQKYFPQKYQYKCILIEDKPENNISQYFEECIQYIDEIVAYTQNIMIFHQEFHQILIKLIVKQKYFSSLLWWLKQIGQKLQIDSEKAFNFVKERHPRAEPNYGFLNQLKTFK